jgi:hypothetical protein
MAKKSAVATKKRKLKKGKTANKRRSKLPKDAKARSSKRSDAKNKIIRFPSKTGRVGRPRKLIDFLGTF